MSSLLPVGVPTELSTLPLKYVIPIIFNEKAKEIYSQ